MLGLWKRERERKREGKNEREGEGVGEDRKGLKGWGEERGRGGGSGIDSMINPKENKNILQKRKSKPKFIKGKLN